MPGIATRQLHPDEVIRTAQEFLLSQYDLNSGGFRFAPNQPVTFAATCQAVLGLECVSGLDALGPGDRSRISHYLLKGVDGRGDFIDPLLRDHRLAAGAEHDFDYLQQETTCFCQQALHALGIEKAPQRTYSFEPTPRGIVRYFDSFPWKNPWLDSNRVMYAMSQMAYEAIIWNADHFLPVIDAGIDWLDAHQSPETGLWSGPHQVPLVNAMAATFHFTFYYFYRNRPLRHPEKIIDSCLALEQEFGLFSEFAIGQTCLDYDAIDLLLKASLFTNHRSGEVRDCAARSYERLVELRNMDGGFPNAKLLMKPSRAFHHRLLRKVSRGRINFRKPYPTDERYVVGWESLSCPEAESNVLSTWFRILALAMSSALAGSSSPVKVSYRPLPFLGYHVDCSGECHKPEHHSFSSINRQIETSSIHSS